MVSTSCIRFIMLGGFLGAGKTTAISRLAHCYQQQGLRVGVVTNDQAENLVDTHTLRSQGLQVGEVAGACFCCNFNELTETVSQLSAEQSPDVVLAEPVGSCTDLVATVIQPLTQLYRQRFDIAPYGVILKPSHGQRILSGQSGGGFSPKAAYIFEKQLEEADFIILNRIDCLARQQVDELTRLIEDHYPDRPMIRMSARTGQGFDQLVEMLEQRGAFGRRILDLDYDTYAEGEAELGWLNATCRVVAQCPFDLDAFLVGVLEKLRASLARIDAETAHLKTIGLWEGYHGVANLTSRDAAVELSLPAQCQTTSADVVVNARVATDPQDLDAHVRAAMESAGQALGATVQIRQSQSFRPGRPVPTHRMAPL